jgi:hypothetical protein
MTASLAFFQSQKNYRYNGIFLEPVDPNIFPLYSQFVTTPMDLGTMKKKLDSLEYDLNDEGASFWSDIRLIVDNCQSYNSRPEGVDRLTQKDFNYVNRVITGFRKLMVAERERFAKRLQKEREKVATVVPVPSHSSSSFRLNLSPGGGGASQRSLLPHHQGSGLPPSSSSPPHQNRLKLSFNINKTKRPSYTPVPFTSDVRSRCLKMFSLMRRVHDPGLEVMKKSCRSRKDYALKIDWFGPDGLKEVEVRDKEGGGRKRIYKRKDKRKGENERRKRTLVKES